MSVNLLKSNSTGFDVQEVEPYVLEYKESNLSQMPHFNQLVQPVDTDSTGTSQGITVEKYTTGRVKVSGTSDAANTRWINKVGAGIDFIGGHKYYIKAFDNIINSYYISCDAFNPSRFGQGIYTAINTGNYNCLLGYANGVSLDLDFYFCVFDLTEIYGADNEPTTVEEFKALFPLDYYSYKTATDNTDGSTKYFYKKINDTFYGYRSNKLVPLNLNLLGGWKTAQLSQIPQWNQIFNNSNESGLQPWAGMGAQYFSKILVDELYEYTVTQGAQGYLYSATSGIVNHKYLVRMQVESDVVATNIYSGSFLGNGLSFSYAIGLNVLEQVVTCRQSSGYVGHVNLFALGNFVFKKLNFIDLTAIFGAGNEPTTVAQFEALFPKAYYEYKKATANTDGSATINYQAIDTTNEIYKYKSSDISLGTGIIEV